MARYIDADRLLTKIHELYVQSNIELWQVVKCVGNSPTADVVPKSEVTDWIITAKENLIRIEELEEELKNISTNVAIEIFEEIEQEIKNHGITYAQRKIAELKKKYTE